MNRDMKVGFVAWNKFQIEHFSNFMPLFPNRTLIIERRPHNEDIFNPEYLEKIDAPIMFVDRALMKNIDKIFDIVFCQTLFPQIEHFENAKIGMLQYGLAKNNHNYGAWRAFADVIFSYGSYSTEKLSHFSPVFELGNPAFWGAENALLGRYKEDLDKCLKELDANKKTILYAPTWGELSSFNSFCNSIHCLNEDYNVILKLHHNTINLNREKVDEMAANGFIQCNTPLAMILPHTDLMISDYSGAIFDALHENKPIVLLRHLEETELPEEKLNQESLEVKMAGDIGPTITEPDSSYILNQVSLLLSDNNPFKTKNDTLRDLLYTSSKPSNQDILSFVENVVDGKIKVTEVQEFVREEVKASRKRMYKIKGMSRKKKGGRK